MVILTYSIRRDYCDVDQAMGNGLKKVNFIKIFQLANGHRVHLMQSENSCCKMYSTYLENPNVK